MRYTGGSNQDHPQEKKKYNTANSLSEEALQIAMKRREAIGKGERKRYTQLNEEFQKKARRDKTFLSEQCERNRGK